VAAGGVGRQGGGGVLCGDDVNDGAAVTGAGWRTVLHDGAIGTGTAGLRRARRVWLAGGSHDQHPVPAGQLPGRRTWARATSRSPRASVRNLTV